MIKFLVWIGFNIWLQNIIQWFHTLKPVLDNSIGMPLAPMDLTALEAAPPKLTVHLLPFWELELKSKLLNLLPSKQKLPLTLPEAYSLPGRIMLQAAPAFHFIFKICTCLGLSLQLSACSNMNYLIQAGRGQWALLSHARPISEVIQDERTPPQLQTLLAEIKPIKKYGEDHGLKPTSNYTEYVKLDRRAAVWLLSACDPLQFKNKEWHFPIVGSFPYLGWFDLETAKKQAELLEKEGWDVDLRGAGAYSTLGWFKDAILSTMISSGNESLGDLVNVVLHESVHATVYIAGQAFFNESIASFVADRLTTQYLTHTRGLHSKEQQAYELREKAQAQRTQQFHTTYLELSKLYASSATNEIKLQKKQEILSKLSNEVHWSRPINNAVLIQYQTYTSAQDDFDQLLAAHHGNWPAFMATLKTLRPESFSKPQQEDLKTVLMALIL